MYECMIAVPYGLKDTNRIIELMASWLLDPDNNMLEVTPANARCAPTRLRQLGLADHMGDDRPQPGRLEGLLRRHAKLHK
jgi:hypothetical protein